MSIVVTGNLLAREPELPLVVNRFANHANYLRSLRCISYDHRRPALMVRDGNVAMLALQATLRREQSEFVQLYFLRDVLENNPDLRENILSRVFAAHDRRLQKDACLYLCSLERSERQRIASALLDTPRRADVRALLLGLIKANPEPAQFIESFRSSAQAGRPLTLGT